MRLLRLSALAMLATIVSAQAVVPTYFIEGLFRQANAYLARQYLGVTNGVPLTVLEQDGVPTVLNVIKIKVSNGTLTDEGSGVISISTGGGGGGGSGTVTNFQASGLSPLFSTAVATPTTYPSVVFSQIVQNPHLFYAGPTSGAAAAPAFRAITDPGDLQIPVITNQVHASNLIGTISAVIGTADYNLTPMELAQGTNTWVDFTRPMQYWPGTGAIAFRFSTNWGNSSTGRISRMFIPPTNYVRSIYVYDAATNWGTVGFASPMILPGGVAAELDSSAYGAGETNVFSQFIISSKQVFNTEVIFNPAAIPGLIFWVDANQKIYQDTAGTIPVSAPGDIVRYWGDISGNGYNTTNPAASDCNWIATATPSGLPAIVWPSAGTAIAGFRSSNTNTYVPPITIFSVYKAEPYTSATPYLFGGTNSASAVAVGVRYGGTAGNLLNASGTAVPVHGTNGLLAAWTLGTYVYDSTQSFSRTNGVNGLTGVNVTSPQLRQFIVGNRGDINNASVTWRGMIAEIIVYNAALSGANITNVERYLAAKYQVTGP